MRKIASNKMITNIFIGLTLLFIVGCMLTMSIVSLNHRDSMIEKSFIIGFILVIITLLYVTVTIYSYQTNRIKIVLHFKKFKWTIWIVSISSITVLLLSCYKVFYSLHYYLFPQAIGFDQRSYWSANASFIYLSIFAIPLILLANLIYQKPCINGRISKHE